MKKIIGAGIGFLFSVMNVNAFASGLDVKPGVNGGGVDFVLGMHASEYTYSAATVKAGKFDEGSSIYPDDGQVLNYFADSTSGSRPESPGRFRLTAGMLEKIASGFENGITIDAPTYKTDIIIANQNRAVGEELVPYANGVLSAGRDTRFRLAVGVGTTALESSIVRDAGLKADDLQGMGTADLAALLNEDETETTGDLADYFDRPVLAIGVNYVF